MKSGDACQVLPSFEYSQPETALSSIVVAVTAFTVGVGAFPSDFCAVVTNIIFIVEGWSTFLQKRPYVCAGESPVKTPVWFHVLLSREYSYPATGLTIMTVSVFDIICGSSSLVLPPEPLLSDFVCGPALPLPSVTTSPSLGSLAATSPCAATRA